MYPDQTFCSVWNLIRRSVSSDLGLGLVQACQSESRGYYSIQILGYTQAVVYSREIFGVI